MVGLGFHSRVAHVSHVLGRSNYILAVIHLVLMKQVWAVKHRPKTIDFFKGQPHLVDEMGSILSGDSGMQHFIFYSPEAGTGKTSLAYILAKGLGYTIHMYNASSQRTRGIQFIEEELAPMTRVGMYETIFFLDEADQLTPAAQSALKGVIEDAQGYFILTCNDLSKLSPWLQSRCQVRTFKPHSEVDIIDRLLDIASIEHIDLPKPDATLIAKANNGDMRNSINALQAYNSVQGSKEQFLMNLYDEGVDAKRVLTLCFKESNVDEAVKEMGSVHDLRNAIDIVFRFGVDSPANPKSKMALVDASTQAHRDLIAGVEPHYVVWDFCRRLAQ